MGPAAGLPLEAERHDPVAATANHIQGVLSALRDLDFGETAPAAATPGPSDDIVRDSPYDTSRRRRGGTDRGSRMSPCSRMS